MNNPYTTRPVISPEYFVASRGGRGAVASRLLKNLCRPKPAPDSISVVSERRCGKTSLLGFLREQISASANVVVGDVDMLKLCPQNPAGLFLALTRALVRTRAMSAGSAILDYLSFEDFVRELSLKEKRMVLFLDEFDLVARNQSFPEEFFNYLRGVANSLPLTLVIASLNPLQKIAHDGAAGSPFFNIFLKEQGTDLATLSRKEAEALIAAPPGGQAGLQEVSSEILDLAGQHPYLLQVACHCAWDLRETHGKVDPISLRTSFTSKVRGQYQSMWEHSSPEEQRDLCRLAHGSRGGGAWSSSLKDRGYVDDSGSLAINGNGFIHFIREQCQAQLPQNPSPQQECATASVRERAILPPFQTRVDSPRLRLAVVVGVNCYQQKRVGRLFLPDLQFAERDADVMADFLQSLGYTVRRLIGPRASCTGLFEAFEWAAKWTAADPHPESSFVFHFSGHGQLDPVDEETAYLMLHDSNPHDPATAGLEMTRLVHGLLPQVRVPHTLATLDACHSGYAAGVKTLTTLPTNQLSNVIEQLVNDLRSRNILAACVGEASAREEANLGHGVFTHYILRHWRDLDDAPASGGISLSSLAEYVGQKMMLHFPQGPWPAHNIRGVGRTMLLRQVSSSPQ